jgi:hypothetical protein
MARLPLVDASSLTAGFRLNERAYTITFRRMSCRPLGTPGG